MGPTVKALAEQVTREFLDERYPGLVIPDGVSPSVALVTAVKATEVNDPEWSQALVRDWCDTMKRRLAEAGL
jgi:hypothetical protein